MISIESSFGFIGVLAFLVALYGIKRYRNLVNPLTIFSVTQIGLFTIFSGIVVMRATPIIAGAPADIIKTILISAVYLSAVSLPYFFRGHLLSNIFGKGLGLLGLNSELIPKQFSFMKFILVLFGAVSAFVALTIAGGGGMQWLTSSRQAYINHRAGAGQFFAITQWFSTFAVVYCIWTIKPRTLKLLLILFFFCVSMYFLGSKNNILTLIVLGGTYYNFYIKRISVWTFLIFVFLMFLAVLSLLFVQGSYVSFSQAGLYFYDYFNTTLQFISRFDEFGLRYGQGWLSSFWFYVPRGLYSDKPYEYGIALIHKVLFPGAAATGNTPGLLPWSLAYLDFGLFGVFIFGLLNGIWSRAAYEYFLKHKQNFFAFILVMQFSIWPIWIFAPLPILVVLSIGQSIFLRLVWRRKQLAA